MYCDTDKIKRRLQRHQNDIMRMVLDSPKRTCVKDMLKKTRWLNVKLWTMVSRLMLLHCCVVSFIMMVAQMKKVCMVTMFAAM